MPRERKKAGSRDQNTKKRPLEAVDSQSRQAEHDTTKRKKLDWTSNISPSGPVSNQLIHKFANAAQLGLPARPGPAFKTQVPSPLPPLPTLQPALQTQVFTHESAASGTRQQRTAQCYERLEILGDAYLEVISCKMIYSAFPDWTAGQISQQREILVRNETLAALALDYGFDKRLLVGRETREKCGRERKEWVKVMGDLMEAYAAAVLLSHGEAGYSILERWLQDLWKGMLPHAHSKAFDGQAKVKLSQRVVSRGVKIQYVNARQPVQVKGEGHTTYFIEARLTGWGFDGVTLGSGEGDSQHEAGQRAAMAALQSDIVTQLTEKKHAHDAKIRDERGNATEQTTMQAKVVSEQ